MVTAWRDIAQSDNAVPSCCNDISLVERAFRLPFSVWELNPRPYINDSKFKDTERNGISSTEETAHGKSTKRTVINFALFSDCQSSCKDFAINIVKHS